MSVDEVYSAHVIVLSVGVHLCYRAELSSHNRDGMAAKPKIFIM